MGVFRIERPQQRPGQAVEKANHGTLPIEGHGTLSAASRFFKFKDWTRHN